MLDRDFFPQHPDRGTLDPGADPRDTERLDPTRVPVLPLPRQPPLHVDELELDVDAHQLRIRGQPVHLTHKEFLLLRRLLMRAGQVCSRRELLDAAWGVDYQDPPTHKSIEVFIRRIRRRLEAAGSSADRIRTIRGLGYIVDL